MPVPRPTLTTERLILRPWREADLEPFAALNADPRAMESMAGPLDRAGSDALVAHAQAHFDAHGFSLWGMEVRGGAPLLGFGGLQRPRFEAPLNPCVEEGRRRDRKSAEQGKSESVRVAQGG